MATTVDFVEYVCEQVRGTGDIRFKKMFGEYMVYVDNKPILLVCDNTVFVKILPALDTLMADAEKGFPYDGAKEHYVLDIDNAELAREVAVALLPVTAVPKPRKKSY
ncbi:MAG: TfoX/Sxy family protein [Coriobacteriales bacterium]|nr:TfoX/Sxy family protein [Coriobacteriales bacterium]